ncbi:Zinc finger MYM-type protein 1-like [Oopsacas minuta]|uniref:Zinc finger MYM-type protein 1-like n=1 Tax=Oopsacas minuta TaxID=111878 RepID=A0AAV7K142_9METZ|nr:Zinc finger MYM-type protein 1-like [Oopsacas minuta]
MLKWSGYKFSLHAGTIEVIFGALNVQAVRDNRHYIQTVGQVITLYTVQDHPLRGQREGRLVDDMGEVIDPEFNCGSRNRGNFLVILPAFGVHNKVIKEKLNGPRNAQYVHHSIQDSILPILANSVRQEILEELKTAKYFSLLTDESRDCEKIQ